MNDMNFIKKFGIENSQNVNSYMASLGLALRSKLTKRSQLPY